MAYYSRKSPRLKDYDYSSENYYFVTICTHDKKCIFGTPEELNALGIIAKTELLQIPSHFDHVKIDQCVVMPNHVHAIVVIGCGNCEGTTEKLDMIVGQYKSGVTRKIRNLVPEMEVWQRSFHDHVIRSRSSYEKIWEYIAFNPQGWEKDCFYCR
jgi:REP element-mobilizing transposase RayT